MKFKWFSKKNKIKDHPRENQLIIKYEYEYSPWSSYSSETRIKRGYIDELRENFKQGKFFNILVISEFNNIKYPFFDIDELSKYNHFVKNATCNYVSLQSSPGHFWIIIDKPFSNFSDFKKDELVNDWIVYSDNKYQTMTNDRKEFHIRGYFEKLERQPVLIDKIGTFSDNFKEFISQLEKYFEYDALELSFLRYKDPDVLLKYRRIKKLHRIL